MGWWVTTVCTLGDPSHKPASTLDGWISGRHDIAAISLENRPLTATPLPNITEALGAALADRFRIERELGRGGMATVYLAHDLRHHRSVALKVLRPELAATLGPERFLHEIRIAAGLQHPHLLPVFDSGDAVGQLWYTMPFVEGETLRQRLLREKQLPLDDARSMAVQVLSALQYAHAHGVIHRDVKPENILLEGDQAVLADLGNRPCHERK